MNIINLTPHAVVVQMPSYDTVTFPPSGELARVETTRVRISPHGVPVPVFKTDWGEVTGLPDPVEGTIYIVSTLVAQQVPMRGDVFSPDTSPSGAIRDESGRVVAVTGLQSFYMGRIA